MLVAKSYDDSPIFGRIYRFDLLESGFRVLRVPFVIAYYIGYLCLFVRGNNKKYNLEHHL